jgi:hypothetical protein
MTEGKEEEKPFRMPSELVTQDCHTIDGTAGLKVSLEFLWSRSIIHLEK